MTLPFSLKPLADALCLKHAKLSVWFHLFCFQIDGSPLKNRFLNVLIVPEMAGG